MLKAVLFDLDNTLILFDEQKYFKSYITQLAAAFADLIPFEKFHHQLIFASQELLKNNGEMSNADYYMHAFARDLEFSKAELWQRFLNFYATGYDQFRELVAIAPGVAELFQYLDAAKLKVVIASNPMFPLSIQLKRVSWAHLENFPFALITHIENMTFCKPRLEYYQQICELIETQPAECLMVGNDPVNDMIVNRLGMKTFLTVDGQAIDESALALSRKLRKGASEEAPIPDFQGPLVDVIACVAALRSNNQ
jgi:FMN phosphatase YigB (HAD superfamily)